MNPADNPCAPSDIKLAEQHGHIEVLESKLIRLEHDHAALCGKLDAIRTKTDRWTGIVGLAALTVPPALGGVIGWFLAKVSE